MWLWEKRLLMIGNELNCDLKLYRFEKCKDEGVIQRRIISLPGKHYPEAKSK